MTDQELHYLLWEYFFTQRWEEIAAEIEREEAAGVAGPDLPERLWKPPVWRLGRAEMDGRAKR